MGKTLNPWLLTFPIPLTSFTPALFRTLTWQLFPVFFLNVRAVCSGNALALRFPLREQGFFGNAPGGKLSVLMKMTSQPV
jgi:hypothetical protein